MAGSRAWARARYGRPVRDETGRDRWGKQMREKVADWRADARSAETQTPVLMGSLRAWIGRSASGRNRKGQRSCRETLKFVARLGRRRLAGVKIGTQVVPRNAGEVLNLQYQLEWTSLALLQTPRNLALTEADLRRRARLVSEQFNRQGEHLGRRRASSNSIGEGGCVKHRGGSMRMRIGESTRKLDVPIMRERIGSTA